MRKLVLAVLSLLAPAAIAVPASAAPKTPVPVLYLQPSWKDPAVAPASFTVGGIGVTGAAPWLRWGSSASKYACNPGGTMTGSGVPGDSLIIRACDIEKHGNRAYYKGLIITHWHNDSTGSPVEDSYTALEYETSQGRPQWVQTAAFS